MRVVTFAELAAMPAGTIYSYYEPCVCDGLMRKGKTILGDDGTAIDWFYASLVAQCWNGEPPTCDAMQSRHAMYDYESEFAVYEAADLAVLRELVGRAE